MSNTPTIHCTWCISALCCLGWLPFFRCRALYTCLGCILRRGQNVLGPELRQQGLFHKGWYAAVLCNRYPLPGLLCDLVLLVMVIWQGECSREWKGVQCFWFGFKESGMPVP